MILQGLTGFASGIRNRDPLATMSAALELAGGLSTKCNIGTLQENLNKIKHWLQFGKAFKALRGFRELDFNTMEVAAVPEVMKVI